MSQKVREVDQREKQGEGRKLGGGAGGGEGQPSHRSQGWGGPAGAPQRLGAEFWTEPRALGSPGRLQTK